LMLADMGNKESVTNSQIGMVGGEILRSRGKFGPQGEVGKKRAWFGVCFGFFQIDISGYL